MENDYHKLLKRQIDKYLSDDQKKDESIKKLLIAVSDIYKDFDEKIEILNKNLETNSQELISANKKLKNQIDAQKDLLEDLQAALIVLDEDNTSIEEAENPNYLSRVLVNLIAKHSQVEEQLKARTQEMEFINKSMIGRELKMVELKKENIELKKQLNLCKKNNSTKS